MSRYSAIWPPPFQRRNGSLERLEGKDLRSGGSCPRSVDSWASLTGNSLGNLCNSCMLHNLRYMVMRSWINSHLDCSRSVLCEALERYMVLEFLECLTVWSLEKNKTLYMCSFPPIPVIWFLSGDFLARFSFPSCYVRRSHFSFLPWELCEM